MSSRHDRDGIYSSTHILRMLQALTQMNLQLNKVISDITGVTGMAIIRAIVAGERNPLVLAELKNSRIKSSTADIASSLTGDYRAEHIFVLKQELQPVQTLLSEVGLDATRFPTVKHFCSWLGLCPSTKITGGKVKSSHTRRVVNRAANAFRLAAQSLSRSQSALGAFYRRLRSRLGATSANTAAAHKLARIFDHLA
jgi:transposase